MKIYVAGPWVSRTQAAAMAAVLEEMGHKITRKWWLFEGTNGNSMGEDGDVELAAADVLGVKHCDLLLALVPKTGGCGMWWESGMAIAWGKEIMQVNLDDGTKPPERRTIFDLMVTRCASVKDALEKIGVAEQKEFELE